MHSIAVVEPWRFSLSLMFCCVCLMSVHVYTLLTQFSHHSATWEFLIYTRTNHLKSEPDAGWCKAELRHVPTWSFPKGDASTLISIRSEWSIWNQSSIMWK